MFTMNCKGRLWVVDKPQVMGIINTTPDSFFEGSRYSGTEAVLSIAEKMVIEGASVLDIGGQSTRPGALPVSEQEETDRVVPAIESLRKAFPSVLLSVDTFRSSVAAAAVEAGASLVNDISAGHADKHMLATVAGLKVPYICMHMKGVPETMQQHAFYEDVCREVLDFFIQKTAQCHAAGIHDIIIDPGFGFAKTAEHNFRLLKHLEIFKILQMPVLAGLSRKSSIYKTLGITAAEALNGTTVVNTLALEKGAQILRVHDVKEAVEAIHLWQAYNSA